MEISQRIRGLNAAVGTVLALGLLGGPEPTLAGPITFNTALPVAEAAVELPLADDLPDTALRDDAFWHVGGAVQLLSTVRL